ncbi:hypothetical protein VNO78_02109 [Psophocarpus tetragonolobus]|uniref:Uncharacterized protein n=1 Tax=Psophocarpus tetragonolobus TaxID=3891 RepID=A0AAN9SYH6_PSOTE
MEVAQSFDVVSRAPVGLAIKGVPNEVAQSVEVKGVILDHEAHFKIPITNSRRKKKCSFPSLSTRRRARGRATTHEGIDFHSVSIAGEGGFGCVEQSESGTKPRRGRRQKQKHNMDSKCKGKGKGRAIVKRKPK